MQVIIMRHGDAVINTVHDVNDIERPLTNRGRYESRLIARYLSYSITNIELVLVSPYLRARQTLDILREHLVLSLAPEEIMHDLIPSANTQPMCEYLQGLHKKKLSNVLVISHLPLVSDLVSSLCTIESPVIFVTSAVVCIELNTTTTSGTLSWKIQPAQC